MRILLLYTRSVCGVSVASKVIQLPWSMTFALSLLEPIETVNIISMIGFVKVVPVVEREIQALYAPVRSALVHMIYPSCSPS